MWARAIVDLADLQAAARPDRTWVTAQEWWDVCGRGKTWSSWESAKRALFRLQEDLRGLGLDLKIETPKGNGLRIHCVSPDIDWLVRANILEASRLQEEAAARKEGRDPQLAEELPAIAQVAADYRTISPTLTALAGQYGRSRKVMRRLVVAAKKPLRARGRPPVELVRPPHRVEQARAARARGASKGELARILGCSRRSVRRWLEREDARYAKPGNVTAAEALAAIAELQRAANASGADKMNDAEIAAEIDAAREELLGEQRGDGGLGREGLQGPARSHREGAGP